MAAEGSVHDLGSVAQYAKVFEAYAEHRPPAVSTPTPS